MGMIIVGWIADRLGLSKLLAEIIMIGVLVLAIIVGALTIRQHYINKGWHNALVAVKKQDDKAVAAAKKVEEKVAECSADSYWDTITQACKTDEE
jgi:hypothetical protein